ncbi:MAG: hypothetical protein HQK60_18920 [Deltaproteobacteria bacterium]|nr:hypothetical protein [Deltaproteobacteria bacterium]
MKRRVLGLDEYMRLSISYPGVFMEEPEEEDMPEEEESLYGFHVENLGQVPMDIGE